MVAAGGDIAVTRVVLTGTDDFVYTPGKKAVLVLDNVTAGALTPIIDGDGAGSVNVGGVGAIDISGGFTLGQIAAGGVAAIRLDTIKEYLAGTIALTGGTGLEAFLLEF